MIGYIQNAINVLTDPNDTNDRSIKDLELRTLRNYYAENIEAHKEYLEKGLYEMIPEMMDFKNQMEQISKIINTSF